MQPLTLIPAVKRRIVDLLAARPGLDGIQVDYAAKGGNLEQRRVFCSDDVDAERTITGARAGRKPRDEEATFGVFFEAQLAGETQEAAELAAVEMASELEDLLAEDPKLGGTVEGLSWCRVDTWRMTAGPVDRAAHLGRVIVGVRFHGRLT